MSPSTPEVVNESTEPIQPAELREVPQEEAEQLVDEPVPEEA